jgi:lipopolysaccharide export LptBFGC system permease protein LptF
LSRKNLAIGTAVILVSFITVMGFLTTSHAALQAINPIAALTAVTVAIVGIAWFKKTSN